jgi:hypothetical protein
MSVVSPAQFAQALSKLKSLSDPQWLERCDELAQQHPTLFFQYLSGFCRTPRESRSSQFA